MAIFTLEDEQIVSDGQIVRCENDTNKLMNFQTTSSVCPSFCPSVKTIF